MFLGVGGVGRARAEGQTQLATKKALREGSENNGDLRIKNNFVKRHVRTSTFWTFPCADVFTVT